MGKEMIVNVGTIGHVDRNALRALAAAAAHLGVSCEQAEQGMKEFHAAAEVAADDISGPLVSRWKIRRGGKRRRRHRGVGW